MARILFAWECGGGIGHLTRYSQLIDKLTGSGHDVLFAARSLSRANWVLGDKGITLAQAPVPMDESRQGVPMPRSYLHVLKNQGFTNPEGLAGRFKAWLALYKLWQPHLIVSDHSPTAIFAAQEYPGAKRVMSGSGFAVPPHRHPFQAFPLEPHFSEETLLEEERAFLQQHINPLMKTVGGSPYRQLCDAFETDARWLFMFKGIDHYPDRASDHYLGTGISPVGDSPVWPTGQGSKIFAYLKPNKGLIGLLEAIRESGLPTLIKGDQLPDSIEQQFSGPTIRFAHNLQNMDEVANTCDLGITNGSPTTTAHFLLAGKPVLMIPLHVEQLLASSAIEAAGYGRTANYLQRTPFSYLSAITELTAIDNKYKQAALGFARANKDYSSAQPTDYMLKDINRLIDLE